MTSGGTESILMACKAYRELGRSKGITAPEIVAALTVHAAFEKAADYFGMKLVKVPVDSTSFRLDVAAAKRAINKNTVLLVASAPCYSQGVVDPVEQLSALALRYKLGLHVDCCLGGFLLPFLPKLGYSIPPFDFSVAGVTSISADTHKYGYSPKGSSVVMYRSTELRHHQYFVSPDWTGGIYASPSMPGSRPGGLIAATWAALVTMGEDGYLECAKAIMKAAKGIEQGICRIKGLRVLGQPDMSVVSFTSEDQKSLNIFKINDAMNQRGWKLNTMQRPSSIHICCTYLHRDVVDKFLADLESSVNEIASNPNAHKGGTAAIYGLAQSLPDNTVVGGFIKDFIDILYQTKLSNS